MTEPSNVTLPWVEITKQWPQSADGKLCARLLKRYIFTLLTQRAAKAEFSLEKAPFNVGVDHCLANLVNDFDDLETGKVEQPKDVPPPKTLNRFREQP